jgi:hypothetical protein
MEKNNPIDQESLNQEISNNNVEESSNEKSNQQTVHNNQQLEEITQKMFSSLSDYLQSELNITNEDYLLLEKLNIASTEKYSNMNKMAETLVNYMINLQQKCNLKTFLFLFFIFYKNFPKKTKILPLIYQESKKSTKMLNN